LLAPSYTYNSLFGQTGTVRYYWYPTDTSQLFTVGSFSQKTNRELKLRYENPSLMDGVLFFKGEGYYQIKGSNRFFGLGPDSDDSDESGYVSKEALGRLQIGFNFFRSWRASFGHRIQRMTTDTNIIPNISDLRARFPGTPGLGTETTSASEFRLLWDTRDLPITPTRGSSGELFIEKTSIAGGSHSDFIRYGLEGKRFFRWNRPKHLTVVHGLYEWANGPHIPFYELPSIGGRNSLRGFGDGRFVDRGRLVFNVEHRITMATLALMGIETNFEIAPFFDIGSVFPTLPEVQRRHFLPVYGAAFRAAVKPNVVGDVEVGVGREGVAVFVDINYPF
jgi:outer membrane protein assembly factor BamA